jgi:hypothetical protein
VDVTKDADEGVEPGLLLKFAAPGGGEAVSGGVGEISQNGIGAGGSRNEVLRVEIDRMSRAGCQPECAGARLMRNVALLKVITFPLLSDVMLCPEYGVAGRPYAY